MTLLTRARLGAGTAGVRRSYQLQPCSWQSAAIGETPAAQFASLVNRRCPASRHAVSAKVLAMYCLFRMTGHKVRPPAADSSPASSGGTWAWTDGVATASAAKRLRSVSHCVSPFGAPASCAILTATGFPQSARMAVPALRSRL